MGKYNYYCVYCGEEIRPEQAADRMMVSLSYAALDGASETTIENHPVYVTRRELEAMINRRDARDRQYISLREYLGFAYRNASNVDDVEEILDAIFEDNNDVEGVLQDCAEQLDEEYLVDEEQDDNTPKTKPLCTDPSAVEQIKKNFLTGKCCLEWSINETKGYLYKLLNKADAKRMITPFWVCSNCKEEILADAFEYRQVLVGLLGFASAGKTCLIAAMCHKLIEQGGILMATKSIQAAYKEMLMDYAGGLALDKTGFEGSNTYHPSVLKNNMLWTFVDIPGETFFMEDNQDLDDKRLVNDPKLQMSLKCHVYILTADNRIVPDKRIVQDKMIGSDTLKTFQRFITFAEAFNPSAIKGCPLLFALTKMDESVLDEYREMIEAENGNRERGEKKRKSLDAPNLPEYCIQDSYEQKYRKELSVIRNLKLDSFVNVLSKRNYLLPLTCAPYGFPPMPCDDPVRNIMVRQQRKDAWERQYLEEHPGADSNSIPHFVYQQAQPRNIDMIIEWLEKLFGARDIQYDRENCLFEKRDLSRLSRIEPHWDDVLVSMIASMFCNPNAADTQWYLTLGDSSFFRSFKQKRIVKSFSKEQLMETDSQDEDDDYRR